MIIYPYSSPEEEFVYEFLTRERVFDCRDLVEATFLKVHDGVSREKVKRIIIRRLQSDASVEAAGDPGLDPTHLPGHVEDRVRVILPDLFWEDDS